MSKTGRSSFILGIVIGMLVIVVLTALAVGLLMSGDMVYRIEIDALNIEAESGLARDIILRNYNAVIAYLNPFNSDSFSMPDLGASEGGINHFKDVKNILCGVYIFGAVCFISIILLSIFFKRRMTSGTLLTISLTIFLLPLTMIVAIALDFDSFFILFHELFFTNDDWIFSQVTDPVITILPAEYFMHCAIVIAVFWLLGSVFYLILSIRKKKKVPNQPVFIPRY
ncbi:MAG: TIGR01906 family membrane protein [Oscillospiraceae bacterium]|nr:TIGR01906 family membrane protein [Oscillospiraceae bacterium]